MNMQNETKTPYFPPLRGSVDCGKCELYGECLSCGRYQRDRRDFSISSGRCPRLPDQRGFMDPKQQTLYESHFPVVYASRTADSLALTLRQPSDRERKIYCSKTGYWYFRCKFEGQSVRRVVTIHDARDNRSILADMEMLGMRKCIYRCTVEDYFV